MKRKKQSTEVVVSDRIRIPKKMMPASVVKKRFEVTLFQDEKCAKCDNFEDRSKDNDLCISCANFGGYFRFFNAKELRDDNVWSLPQADEHSIRHYLNKKGVEYSWIDKRDTKKMKHPVKFIGRLFRDGDVDNEGREKPDQLYAARQWWKKKTGVLQAPARAGKTVLATFLTCKLGVKTVIIASQKDWLRQFYETMTGKLPPRYLRNKIVQVDGIVGREAMTNIPDLQSETEEQVVFQPESFGALERFMKNTKEIPDILLITYQSFRRDDSRVAEILNKHYSFVIIDEEHSVGATEYLRFVSKLNMTYRLGLSATPDRKDKRCLDNDTLITLYPSGSKRIADLVTGDLILSPSGNSVKVIATEKTTREAYIITLVTDEVIICSGEHRFMTNRGVVECKNLKDYHCLAVYL